MSDFIEFEAARKDEETDVSCSEPGSPLSCLQSSSPIGSTLSTNATEIKLDDDACYEKASGLGKSSEDCWGVKRAIERAHQKHPEAFSDHSEDAEEIELSCSEKNAYPSSPEQSYENASDDDDTISDVDFKIFGYQFQNYIKAQQLAAELYSAEKLVGEKDRFDVKWRGPKDNIYLSSFNSLKNMRSPSNSFRRHELESELLDNKMLRAVYYRAFGGNTAGNNVQLYEKPYFD